MTTPAASVANPFLQSDKAVQVAAGPALAQFLNTTEQKARESFVRAIRAMRNPAAQVEASMQLVINFLNQWPTLHTQWPALCAKVQGWKEKKPAVTNMEFGASLAGKVCIAVGCVLGIASLGLHTSYGNVVAVIAARIAAIALALAPLMLQNMKLPFEEEAREVCVQAACAVGLFSLGLQEARFVKAVAVAMRLSAAAWVAGGLACWRVSVAFGRIAEVLEELTVANLKDFSGKITASYNSSVVMRIYLWKHRESPPQEHPGTDLLTAQLAWVPAIDLQHSFSQLTSILDTSTP